MRNHPSAPSRWVAIAGIALVTAGCATYDPGYYGNASYGSVYSTQTVYSYPPVYSAAPVYVTPAPPATVYYPNTVYIPPPQYVPIRPARPSYRPPPKPRPPNYGQRPPAWSDSRPVRPNTRPPQAQAPYKPPSLNKPFTNQATPPLNNGQQLRPADNQGAITVAPKPLQLR